MLLLCLAIACSVAVSILLKLARNYQLDIAQAILVNYGVASALTLFLLQPKLTPLAQPSSHWLLLLALGVLLPSVFLIMAKAVAHAGIALSDAAQRLSLILPLLAAFLLFAEPLSGSKLFALLLAGLALLALIKPSQEKGSLKRNSHWLLLGVWLGYGVIDISFKQLAKAGAAFSSSLLVSFIIAGVLLGGYLCWRKTKWQVASLRAGLVLGVLNFGNIYAYIRAHQSLPDSPALVFTAMNIGVIVVGTLSGTLLFKEKLSRTNLVGMGLAISAIILLFPW